MLPTCIKCFSILTLCFPLYFTYVYNVSLLCHIVPMRGFVPSCICFPIVSHCSHAWVCTLRYMIPYCVTLFPCMGLYPPVYVSLLCHIVPMHGFVPSCICFPIVLHCSHAWVCTLLYMFPYCVTLFPCMGLYPPVYNVSRRRHSDIWMHFSGRQRRHCAF